MLYVCKPTAHVGRLGEPLDEYVETLVLGYLSDPETRRLTVMLDGNTVDVDGLHTQRAAMQARLDDLAAMFADGAIDASQLRRSTSDLRTQLAGIDNTLGELSRSPTDRCRGQAARALGQAVARHERQSSARDLVCNRATGAARGQGLRLRPDRHRLEGVTMAWAARCFRSVATTAGDSGTAHPSTGQVRA